MKIFRNIFVSKTQNWPGVGHKCCACGKTSQHLGNMFTAAVLPPQCVLVLPTPISGGLLHKLPKLIRLFLSCVVVVLACIKCWHALFLPPGKSRVSSSRWWYVIFKHEPRLEAGSGGLKNFSPCSMNNMLCYIMLHAIKRPWLSSEHVFTGSLCV